MGTVARYTVTAGEAPSATLLEIAEIGINFADLRVYAKKPDGTVVELLPARLQADSLLISDYNAITDNGYYRSDPTALNKPDVNYYLVHVQRYDTTTVQTATQYDLGSKWRRVCVAGIWSVWTRVYETVADQAASRMTGVPVNSSSTGVAGQLAIDSSYLYVCIATDTWRRIALGSAF